MSAAFSAASEAIPCLRLSDRRSAPTGKVSSFAHQARRTCVSGLTWTVFRRAVKVLGVPCQGIDQGGRAARWLSGVLGVQSRLVHVPPEHNRIAGGWVPGPSNYADSSAVHLISQASLDTLNLRLAEIGEPPVPMARFRPNIVVSGWDEPHLEDQVRWLGIGDANLAYAKLANRCAVTLVDQSTGMRTGREPLHTLAAYRRTSQGRVTFGVKLSVVSPGKLAVGDHVFVSSWATRNND